MCDSVTETKNKIEVLLNIFSDKIVRLFNSLPVASYNSLELCPREYVFCDLTVKH